MVPMGLCAALITLEYRYWEPLDRAKLRVGALHPHMLLLLHPELLLVKAELQAKLLCVFSELIVAHTGKISFLVTTSLMVVIIEVLFELAETLLSAWGRVDELIAVG